MSQIFVPKTVRHQIKKQVIIKPRVEKVLVAPAEPKITSEAIVQPIIEPIPVEEPKVEEPPKEEVEVPQQKKKVEPEKKKEYNKTYYKRHIEEHKAKHKIRVQCDNCGKYVNKQNLQAHKNRSRCINRKEILMFQQDLIKQYPLPVKPQPEKYSFINYEHIQRGLDLIDLISKSFKK